MKNFERNVTLYCPLCGNDLFESIDTDDKELLTAPDNVRLRCSDCNSIFSKAELLAENRENIEINIQEAEQEIIDDLEKRFRKIFK